MSTEKTRREIMRDIEAKHFGRCLDQVWADNRRVLIERMELRGKGTAVVVKQYESRVPTMSSSKPWPELSGAWVYVEVEQDENTWDALDRALQAHRDKVN